MCKKMAMEDGCNVFFFHDLAVKILLKFDPKIAKLVKFTLFKQIQNFLNFFVTNGKISPEKKTLDGRLKNWAGEHEGGR